MPNGFLRSAPKCGWAKAGLLLFSILWVIPATSAEKKRPSKLISKYHHHPWALSIGLNYSFTSQPAVEIDTESGPTSIGKLSGQATYFSFFLDRAFEKKNTWRVGLLFRRMRAEGKVTPISSSVSTESTKVVRQQELLGLLLMYRKYPWEKHDFWWGVGAEISKVTAVRVDFSDSGQAPLSEDDLPLFGIVSAAFGYDVHLVRSLYLLPEFRLGYILGANPAITVIEGTVSVGHGF